MSGNPIQIFEGRDLAKFAVRRTETELSRRLFAGEVSETMFPGVARSLRRFEASGL